MQKLDSGITSVLITRRARTSYGVICKQKYGPLVHFNEDMQKRYNGRQIVCHEPDRLDHQEERCSGFGKSSSGLN